MRGVANCFVVVFLCWTSRGEPQLADRIYPLIELTDGDLATIDVVDGSVADWQTIMEDPTATARDFISHPRFSSYDPADLDFRIWIGWHNATDRLFLAVERVDDVYVNQFDREKDLVRFMGFHDSYVQFLVDGDHSGGQFWLFDDDTPSNGQAQFYEALAEVFDDGPKVNLAPTGNVESANWFYSPPYADGGGASYGENPNVSVTELYVTPYDRFAWSSPDDSEVSDLVAGKTIGFMIVIPDSDTDIPADWKSIHVLAGADFQFGPKSEVLFTFADDFADGLLVGADGKIPGDTAVENGSWGLIKASLFEQ